MQIIFPYWLNKVTLQEKIRDKLFLKSKKMILRKTIYSPLFYFSVVEEVNNYGAFHEGVRPPSTFYLVVQQLGYGNLNQCGASFKVVRLRWKWNKNTFDAFHEKVLLKPPKQIYSTSRNLYITHSTFGEALYFKLVSKWVTLVLITREHVWNRLDIGLPLSGMQLIIVCETPWLKIPSNFGYG